MKVYHSLCLTGTHVLMQHNQLREGFHYSDPDVAPLDAPDFVPAGSVIRNQQFNFFTPSFAYVTFDRIRMFKNDN